MRGSTRASASGRTELARGPVGALVVDSRRERDLPMAKLRDIVIDAFLDGFTGAGLFGRLRRPGAPTEYVDSRGIAELKASGDFDRIWSRDK
jgi:hypothetical protein